MTVKKNDFWYPRSEGTSRAEKRQQRRSAALLAHNTKRGVEIMGTKTGFRGTNYDNAAENRKNLGCTTGRPAHATQRI